jgi:subfamily B ATP-binding cassette protein MsbA
MTALVGQSGSGKSTFLNLIPRIYDPLEGTINIDNQDLKSINLKSLREKISIVDQNTTLFDDTVFNNIKYANPDASDEEVYTAAKLAMCETFIKKLDDGFLTYIGENGTRLSGGEKAKTIYSKSIFEEK